jgi:uncharacterized protein YcfL
MLGLKDVKREHMKKLALVFVVALGFTSCDVKTDIQPTSQQTLSVDESIKVIEFKGHEYLIYDGYNSGGICHSESCPCKNK